MKKNMLRTLAVSGVIISAIAYNAIGVEAEPSSDQFEALNDYEMLDKKTNLLWERNYRYSGSGGIGHQYHAASSACTNTGFGWRLPTVVELSSIVDEQRHNMALDPRYFMGPGGFGPQTFWASGADLYTAPIVDFRTGEVKRDVATNRHQVRCVKTNE